MQFSHSCDSKISDKINTLKNKVEGNHVVQKPDRIRFVKACKSRQVPVYLVQGKGGRNLMVQCGVIDLPVIAADRCRSRGGSGGKGNQLE